MLWNCLTFFGFLQFELGVVAFFSSASPSHFGWLCSSIFDADVNIEILPFPENATDDRAKNEKEFDDGGWPRRWTRGKNECTISSRNSGSSGSGAIEKKISISSNVWIVFCFFLFFSSLIQLSDEFFVMLLLSKPNNIKIMRECLVIFDKKFWIWNLHHLRRWTAITNDSMGVAQKSLPFFDWSSKGRNSRISVDTRARDQKKG